MEKFTPTYKIGFALVVAPWLFSAILILLKVFNFIDWTWLTVLAPILIPLAVLVLILAIGLIFYGGYWITKLFHKK